MLELSEIANCQRSWFSSPPISHQQHCSSAYYLGELKPKRPTENTVYPIGIPITSIINSYCTEAESSQNSQLLTKQAS